MNVWNNLKASDDATVTITVGSEGLLPMNVSASKGGKTCLKSMRTRIDGCDACQVILTRTGKAPYSIAGDRRASIIPIAKRNIIAQAMIVDGTTFIGAAVVKNTTEDSILFMDDDEQDEIIDTHRDSIAMAVDIVLNGGKFIFIKEENKQFF